VNKNVATHEVIQTLVVTKSDTELRKNG